ncbi:pentapeptide repeat-containing protein [Haloparvum sp. AD34]
METPDGKCGFSPASFEMLRENFNDEVETDRLREAVGKDINEVSSNWADFKSLTDLDELGAEYTCCRDIWKNGRCVWHARENGKDRMFLHRARQPPKDTKVRAPQHRFERLDGVYLKGADLRGIHLSNCTLTGAWLQDADLSDSDLHGADLSNTLWGGVSARNANLGNASLTNIRAGSDENDFSDAYLVGADFSDSRFPHSNFSGATLTGAKMQNANISDCDFSEASVGGANLVCSLMNSSDLTDADFPNSDLTEASLEGCNLTRADFRDACLKDSKLYKATLAGMNINRSTELGNKCYYETTQNDTTADDTPPLEKAVWIYHAYRELTRENGFPSEARHFYIREKDVLRQRTWQRTLLYQGCHSYVPECIQRIGSRVASIPSKILRGLYGFSRRIINLPLYKSLSYEISRRSTRYGESPWRVVTISILFIIVSAILYPLSGIQRSQGTSTITYSSDMPITQVMVESLYFSSVTFTTLSYGNFQPVGWGRGLAMIESFTGALLMALLVFVLARRATW